MGSDTSRPAAVIELDAHDLAAARAIADAVDATVTVPAALWAEAIESLGGFGLCNPGDLLTRFVIDEAADLARRMEEEA